jgi:hypothetical protein
MQIHQQNLHVQQADGNTRAEGVSPSVSADLLEASK